LLSGVPSGARAKIEGLKKHKVLERVKKKATNDALSLYQQVIRKRRLNEFFLAY